MSAPTNIEEYQARFHENTRVTGFGIGVATHAPCPWCAAPDFQVLRPASGIADDGPNIDEQLESEHTCSECGRSGRSLVQRDASGVRFEFVQTGGDDPPEWLRPAPRRLV